MAKTSKSETTAELAEREAAMAKAMSMSVLFQKEYFKDIITAVKKKDGAAFITVCKKANLDKADQDWLWNYLQNYHEGHATLSDKKWKVASGVDLAQW